MSDSSDDVTLQLLQLLALLGGAETAASLASEALGSKRTPPRYGEYILVAAIDFGTTFSGYAFSFKTEQKVIRMNKNWGAELGHQSYKTPTCILLDEKDEFKSFGYEAQQEYANLDPEQIPKFCFFDRFKMELHNVRDLKKDTMIEASNGKKKRALDIFSMSLVYLKDHMTKAIEGATANEVDGKLMRWVITVPAIWSDASKQFMREAALQAGLIKELDSNQLIIALEPEAASLFVRSLEINQFAAKSDVAGRHALTMDPGTHYLVIDAGGGTLDITAHELLDEGKVKELHYATGGAFGGIKVDENFINLVMKAVFGDDFIEKFKSSHPSQWFQILSEFEKKKRTAKAGKSTNIQLSWSFGEVCMELNKMGVEKMFQKYNDSSITFNNGVMSISDRKMQEIFHQVIAGILDHIEQLLKHPKLQDVKYFFCVGGFSESLLLQEAIRRKFESRVKILVPEEASLAVVKGAVMFGHQPDSISSRVSAITYGVKSVTQFIPILHPREKAVPIDGKIYCRDIFNKYLTKGQEVPLGYTEMSTFSPVRADQDEAEIEIYSVDKERVEFVTDPGVHHHGTISVDWQGHGTDRKLEITMIFGGTEIQVSAVSYPGEKKANTKINFMTE